MSKSTETDLVSEEADWGKGRLVLTSWGDPVLDELAATQKERKARPKAEDAQRCPSCGKTCILIKGFYATICSDCHADIERLARARFW